MANCMMQNEVRDPVKWQRFINRMGEKAKAISSNARSRLYLRIDLGIDDPKLAEIQQEHAAIYKLLRIAKHEENTLNRRELLNLFNAIIHGPKELKAMALSLVRRIEE